MDGRERYRQGFLRVQDGLKLAYRDYPPLDPQGRARLPLFCLAGITRNSNDFHVPALHWSKTRRVIALDLRGRGLSERDPSGKSYHPEAYLSDIRCVLTALDLGRVIFCGTSLGGYLVMGVALFSPTAIAAAILNEASPVVDPALVESIQRNATPLTSLRPKDHESAKAALKEALPHLGLTIESDWDALTEGSYQPDAEGQLVCTWDPLLVAHMDPAPTQERLWPFFGALKSFPLLLVRGGKSGFITDETLARMQALHAGMGVVTVPGAGHSPTLKEPETAAAIDRFFQEIDPP
ncbi:MAG: alpha/beta hydrolase [Pseudomonadota bacterium]